METDTNTTQNDRLRFDCPKCGKVRFYAAIGARNQAANSNRLCNKCSHPQGNVEELFWRHVNKAGENDCWNWTGFLWKTGYGCFGTVGFKCRAHRYSYELHKGPIPEGLIVRHECDNPSCVNPNHLTIGTVADNSADCVKRGRINRGVDRYNHVLTEQNVLDIRRRYELGEGMYPLAAEFKVSRPMIGSIIHRRRWKHI